MWNYLNLYKDAFKDGGSGLNDYILSKNQSEAIQVPKKTPGTVQENVELPPAPARLPGSTRQGAVPMRRDKESDFMGYYNLEGRRTYPMINPDGS